MTVLFDESDPIEVLTLDSHKRRVRPRAVVWEGQQLFVAEVEDSFVATGLDPSSEVRHGWVVRCEGGARFRLVWSEELGWRGSLLPGPRAAD